MKVKVIKKFRDKNTQAIHKVGETMTISKKRFEEILSVGKFVESVDKDTEADAEDEAEAETEADAEVEE